MDGSVPVYSTGSFDCSLGSCSTEVCDLLATDIQEKTAKEVKKHYHVFETKWKPLAGMSLYAGL